VRTDAGSPVRLFARSEGRWGNSVRASLEFATRPLTGTVTGPSHLEVGRREWVPGGSLLRLTSAAGARQLCFVDSSTEVADPAGPGTRRVLTLETPAAFVPERLELVTATLEVVDRDPAYPRQERIEGIGLRTDHPRWLARVVVLESTLCWPGRRWAGASIRLPDPDLPTLHLEGSGRAGHMTGGRDLWDAIVPEDFHDDRWVPGDEEPGDGVQCLSDLDDVGLVVAPDLYDPAPLVPQESVTDPPTLCGPDFAVHVGTPPLPPPEAPPAPGLTGLALDPRVPADLDRVVANQRALAEYAALRRDHTLLLDVPLGLTHGRMLAWRDAFDSPYVAAYHPWLDIASVEDRRDGLVRLNPSAFAAGVVAERELRLGVQYGPANEIAVGAVRPAELVPTDRHDELHVNGVNVFRAERDGIRLWGARTLSRDPLLRQLSVARLMTVLRLTLEREMQWAVFEPSNQELWGEVRRMVTALLTRLHEGGAFAGATTSEAFFVRCDRSTMTRNDLDAGRLVCLVGVAPTEPLEYIVVEIALAATEGISVDARVG
jgi:hypothetical protein